MCKVIWIRDERESQSMISIYDVAAAFLTKEFTPNKKLQKLCYYSQAWYLALNSEPLIKDCRFEAWIHGPVCPELYFKYREYGPGYILAEGKNGEKIFSDSYLAHFIERIYETYGKLSGDELEMLTHIELPWIKARKGLSDWQSSNNSISNEDMMSYFSELLQKTRISS